MGLHLDPGVGKIQTYSQYSRPVNSKSPLLICVSGSNPSRRISLKKTVNSNDIAKKKAANQVRYKGRNFYRERKSKSGKKKQAAVQTLAMTAGLLARTPKTFCLISVRFRTMIDKWCYICQNQKQIRRATRAKIQVRSQPHRN